MPTTVQSTPIPALSMATPRMGTQPPTGVNRSCTARFACSPNGAIASRTRCSGQIGSSENQARRPFAQPGRPRRQRRGRPRQRASSQSAVHRPMPGSRVTRSITSSLAKRGDVKVGVGQCRDRPHLHADSSRPVGRRAAPRPGGGSATTRLRHADALPQRLTSAARMTAAARSEICWAVTAVTTPRTGRPERRAEARRAGGQRGYSRANASMSKPGPQQVRHLGRGRAGSSPAVGGDPVGIDAHGQADPRTRCRPPSCQRLARSSPNSGTGRWSARSRTVPGPAAAASCGDWSQPRRGRSQWLAFREIAARTTGRLAVRC